MWWLFFSSILLLSILFTIINFQYKYLLFLSLLFTFISLPFILLNMPSTFQFSFDCSNNSGVKEIEVRCTRTQYCPNHLLIILWYKHGGGNASAEINKGRDVEWTWNIHLHPSDFINFEVTHFCPGVKDLAICIFNKEHHTSLRISNYCPCYQWV